jgi:hypothetical protein
MQSFKELARKTRAEERAKDRNRVLESQWQLQNVACVQLAMSLGLLIHWRTRRSNAFHDRCEQAGDRLSRSYDVTHVTGCAVPPDWRPVDPAIAAEYGGIGAYIRHKRVERIERELRARAAEVAKSTGNAAVLDTLRVEKHMTRATGTA